MDKREVIKLKQKMAEIAQEICNEVGWREVSFNIETETVSNLKGSKSTLVTNVQIQINEEI